MFVKYCCLKRRNSQGELSTCVVAGGGTGGDGFVTVVVDQGSWLVVSRWRSVNMNFGVRVDHSDLSVSQNPIPKPEIVVLTHRSMLKFKCSKWSRGEPRLVGIGGS